MGSCCSRPEEDKQETFNSIPVSGTQNVAQELPPGWKMVPSRSRPGKVSYQNIHTGERISWVPKEEAKPYKGAIKRKKKNPVKKTNENPDNAEKSNQETKQNGNDDTMNNKEKAGLKSADTMVQS